MNQHHRRRWARPFTVGTFAMMTLLALSSTAQTPTLRSPVQTARTTPTAVKPAPQADTPSKTPTTPQPSDNSTPYQTTLRPSQTPPASSTFDVTAFESLAKDLTNGKRIPGLAMAIVKDGRIVSARGYGITDVDNPQSVNPHTVFRLASLSKAFASALTGLLVDEGAIRWDSKVVQYVPRFHLINPTATRQVRVADLLSHRTGLRWHNALDREIEKNATYYTVTQKLATVPLSCKPGDCYEYQNVAFSLIGDVIHNVTGTRYEQAVRQRLLTPLGMHDASLGLAGIENSPSWARPHVRTRNGWASLAPKPTYYRLAPAAGVNASASDMAQWMLAQLGHRPDVLPTKLLATLHAPLIETPDEMQTGWRGERVASASYALAWRVLDYSGQQVMFHAGAVQGYRSMIALIPGHDFGVAILWNSNSGLPGGLLPTMLDTALGLPPQQWLETELGAQLLMAQTGGHPSPQATHMASDDNNENEEDTSNMGGSSSTALAAPY